MRLKGRTRRVKCDFPWMRRGVWSSRCDGKQVRRGLPCWVLLRPTVQSSLQSRSVECTSHAVGENDGRHSLSTPLADVIWETCPSSRVACLLRNPPSEETCLPQDSFSQALCHFLSLAAGTAARCATSSLVKTWMAQESGPGRLGPLPYRHSVVVRRVSFGGFVGLARGPSLALSSRSSSHPPQRNLLERSAVNLPQVWVGGGGERWGGGEKGREGGEGDLSTKTWGSQKSEIGESIEMTRENRDSTLLP